MWHMGQNEAGPGPDRRSMREWIMVICGDCKGITWTRGLSKGLSVGVVNNYYNSCCRLLLFALVAGYWVGSMRHDRADKKGRPEMC